VYELIIRYIIIIILGFSLKSLQLSANVSNNVLNRKIYFKFINNFKYHLKNEIVKDLFISDAALVSYEFIFFFGIKIKVFNEDL
jgi:hypothetical protein